MAINQIVFNPTELANYAGATPVIQEANPIADFTAGADLAQKMLIQPALIDASKAGLANVASQARGDIDLRPAEIALKKKQIAADVSDLEATAAQKTANKKAALDVEGLTLDLQKALFPTTAATATDAALTGANEAALGKAVSNVRVAKLGDITDVVSGELMNAKAKVALEGAELLRLKDDPTKLKESLGKKLIEIAVPFSPDEPVESLYAKWKNGRNAEIQQLLTIEGIKHGPDANNIPKLEEAVRAQFMGNDLVKRYNIVAEAVGKVKASAGKENPSAADDMSTIFGFMRVLDPGSTVREGEFATAQNATGVPEKIRNYYNQLLSGNRLNPGQRQDFINAADDLFKVQQQAYDKHKGVYERIAVRTGLNPLNVVGDVAKPGETGYVAPPDSSTGKPAPVNATSGRKRIKLRDGRTVFGHFVKDPATGVTVVEVDSE
jgi:hypothetical protein